MYLVQVQSAENRCYFVGVSELVREDEIGGFLAKRYPSNEWPRFRYVHLGKLMGSGNFLSELDYWSSKFYEIPWITRTPASRNETVTLPPYVSKESAQACLNKNFPTS